MGLSTLSVRDIAQTMFQFSKTLVRVILVRSHEILCVETHLGDLLGVAVDSVLTLSTRTKG